MSDVGHPERNRKGDKILSSRRSFTCGICKFEAQHPKRDQRPIDWWTVEHWYVCNNCTTYVEALFPPED